VPQEYDVNAKYTQCGIETNDCVSLVLVRLKVLTALDQMEQHGCSAHTVRLIILLGGMLGVWRCVSERVYTCELIYHMCGSWFSVCKLFSLRKHMF
jgi:hypothetical protein